MRVAERVDGDAAEEIEIFFARRVIDVAAAPVGQDERTALVGGEQELLRSAYARVQLRRPRMHDRLARAAHDCFRFGGGAHHATDTAVRAEESGSRSTRVPGKASMRSSAEELSEAREARRTASGAPPPMIRTSRTPPSRARLAASSFNTMPPETTRDCTRRSISSQAIADRTFSPSSTPATSVR